MGLKLPAAQQCCSTQVTSEDTRPMPMHNISASCKIAMLMCADVPIADVLIEQGYCIIGQRVLRGL